MQQVARLALISAAVLAAATASIAHNHRFLDPKGAGVAESAQEAACAECQAHSSTLTDCVCFVTDVAGTFEDDSTKTLTTRKGYGFETQQTGADRLPEAWHWHCRPITSTPGVWKQC
eukprot:TRINITY_DN944_c0_g1_i2.p2 TRINITY_DN944_c0_g1~~TRINITY_DN944_c0_g1_i2.p2  ORF type:complete len:137 (+),score=21.74 TRINITY_DN944_c0_g1_i2:62-412(+)